MDSEKCKESSASICDKKPGWPNSVSQLNSKDELNWVENEIIIVGSLNDKISESADRAGSSKDSANDNTVKVADTKTSGISKSANDENEAKLWEYFTEHNSSQLKCNLCKGLFLYQGNASHLLRHVEVTHHVPVLAENKHVKDVVMAADLKTVSNRAVNPGLDVQQPQESLVDKEISTDLSSRTIQQDVVVSSELSDKVHEYFTRLESGKMRCNLCCRVLSYDSDKSTIFRHLHSNHGDTYKFIMESTKCKDIKFIKSVNINDIGVAAVVSRNKTKRRKKKKVICIGEYFAELEGTGRVKCKFCKTVLKYCEGMTTNLIRHLKSKHQDLLFKKDLTSSRKTKEPNSTLILEILQVDDKCFITNAQLQIENKKNLESSDTNSYKLTTNDQTESPTRAESNEKYFSVENLENRNSNKIQILDNNEGKTFWNYFTKSHTNHMVECNICSNIFTNSSSTDKLINHLSAEHGIDLSKQFKSHASFEFETFISETCSQNDEHLNFEYELKSELTVNDITNINMSSILHSEGSNRSKIQRKPRRKVNLMSSRLWKYFTKLYRGKVICNICERSVSYKLGQISHLLKHLQIQHKVLLSKSDKKIMIERRNKRFNKTDLVWKFFTKLDDTKAECNLCEYTNVQHYSSRSRSNLMKHLRRKHKYFLNVCRGSEERVVNDDIPVPEINNISDQNTNEPPGINMKTLFAYFSNNRSLQRWIKFENDQIVCKLCTGMFICDNLLNFGDTMKRHIQTCHAFPFVSLDSAFTNYNISSDNDDEHEESETDEKLEVLSDSSYNELEAISKEINSFLPK